MEMPDRTQASCDRLFEYLRSILYDKEIQPLNPEELDVPFRKLAREMKDQIIKLLDDWKGQQKEHEKPEKKTEQEK
jgi:hypothetical protein